MDLLQPAPTGQQTRGKNIFVALGVAALVGFFCFLGLIVYYSWRIKYGDGQTLAKEFQQKNFTVLSTAAQPAQIIDSATFPRIIRPENPVRGKSDAPITIVSFIDFECPFSRAAHSDFEAVVKKYEPVVRIVFKHLPIEAIHPNAMNAAHAAACAHEAGKFWDYYDRLFTEQTLDADSLRAHAAAIGISPTAFDRCFDAKKYQKNIDADVLDVATLGIRGTPTYIVNETIVEGATGAGAWDRILLHELKRR